MHTAVIDVGSNTIRMVIGHCRNGQLIPHQYYRKVVRLAGDFSPRSELADASISRAFTALKSFSKILTKQNIFKIRCIGTAVLRRAVNRQFFIDKLFTETGLVLEIISGEEEASLTARGVLSVIHPAVNAAIILDIGGGSTEFICSINQKIHLQKSYPLGVVRLCEEFSTAAARQKEIEAVINDYFFQLDILKLSQYPFQLIGTAGTVTTLAAMDLKLNTYTAEKINNHFLSKSYLFDLKRELEVLSIAEREQLAGMEPGRGDLIVHGLDIILALLDKYSFPGLIVTDAGLLEGAFLDLCSVNSD